MDGAILNKKYNLVERVKALEEGGGGGSSKHEYSTEEQEVGTWIDGKTMYERTFILKENGEDKYPKGGFQTREYLIGLTGCDKVWIKNLWSDRGETTTRVLSDSRNLSNEIITGFDLSTGGVFLYNSHAPMNVFVVLQYTKQTETKKRSKKS